MKYIIYIRVSKEEQIHSLDVQRDACRAYIQSQDSNAEIIEFRDVEYCGALKFDKRPGLFEALSMMDRGDILVVQKRDRIGRDPVNNAMIEAEVKKKKGYLVSASSDFNTDSDPYSILMRRMLDVFSEHERLIISARTTAALRMKRAKNQVWGTHPYGFKRAEDNIHLVPCEKEFPALELIKTLRQEKKYGYRKIAGTLNKMGYLNRHGNPWAYQRISEILRDSDYINERYKTA